MRLQPVMAVLPPPAAWESLAGQIAARPLPSGDSPDLATPVLRTVAGALQGNHEAMRQGIDTLEKQIEGQEQAGWNSNRDIGELQDAFLTQMGDKHAMLTNFEARHALLKSDTGSAAENAQRERLRSNTLPVPDLVALAGEARAEALLKEVFSLELEDISIQGSPTKALARKIALELGGQLKFAPWNLVDTLDSAPL